MYTYFNWKFIVLYKTLFQITLFLKFDVISEIPNNVLTRLGDKMAVRWTIDEISRRQMGTKSGRIEAKTK